MPKRKSTLEASQGIITSDETQALLKAAHPVIKDYIAALEAENRKAQANSVQLQAENMSYKNRGAAMEKELEKSHNTPQYLDFIKELRKLGEKLEKKENSLLHSYACPVAVFPIPQHHGAGRRR